MSQSTDPFSLEYEQKTPVSCFNLSGEKKNPWHNTLPGIDAGLNKGLDILGVLARRGVCLSFWSGSSLTQSQSDRGHPQAQHERVVAICTVCVCTRTLTNVLM